MHDRLTSVSDYAKHLDAALNDSFLRRALDTFAVAYKANREAVFSDVDEQALIRAVSDSREAAAAQLDELCARFTAKAEALGVRVHRAADAAEANRLMIDIARENSVRRVIKAKSMTAEEIGLNAALEGAGLQVDETDLGEWIIQLRHEGPSHMVMPAIHLSRGQVAEDFSKFTGIEQDREDVQKLVKVARVQLRPVFAQADMGITGANFAVAETGAMVTVTNEGNARMVTTLPRVHVALMGLDKLVPRYEDALAALEVLPRNATAQRLTASVSWISGTEEGKVRHFILLDNGRAAVAKDPLFSQIFRCVRCGACANVCPVYRLVGGHRMGHIYIGAIGLILTYLFHDKAKAHILCHNCTGCEACKTVCAGGIDLPRLIREIRARLNEEQGSPLESALIGKVMASRELFHRLLSFMRFAQKPVTSGGFVRHLPAVLLGRHGYKSLPALADKPFRRHWPELTETLPEPEAPVARIAIFAGCAQDFMYPEQLKACVRFFHARNATLLFPMQQTCCGLPLSMMGERAAALAVARQNVEAFSAPGFASCDHIVTLCASCAAHLRHVYPQYDPAFAAFAEKIVDFSTLARKFLERLPIPLALPDPALRIAYHASCHLYRGLGVHDAPRELIARAGTYLPTPEEDVCCGFGGTYSVKFPQVSAGLLDKKLNACAASGATHLAVDCPGCVMQLRGGADARGMKLKVVHMAELFS